LEQEKSLKDGKDEFEIVDGNGRTFVWESQ
jgi:hypothetical protein